MEYIENGDSTKANDLLQYDRDLLNNKDRALKLMEVNGGFIEYMDPEMLMSDPAFTADLILAAQYGFPCEALRKLTPDRRFHFEVAKQIVAKSPDDFQWVVGHLLCNDPEAEEALSRFKDSMGTQMHN